MSAATFKAWISAARLRTLPLSISGIITGTAYGYGVIQTSETTFNIFVPMLALLTTLGFQVLSNFANDYGDGVKGTDNENRVGPVRALQSGVIKPHQMKLGIIITSIISFLSAVLLIYVSLGSKAILVSLFFLVLGVLAIWAAIKYTVGDNAYGYRGLGDLFVFIFFGPVSVLGIYYLLTLEMKVILLLPAITIGLLSVAVLNLNNMRDMESDALVGKNTIVVKIGITAAKKVHYALIGIAFMSAFIIALLSYTSGFINSIAAFLPLIAFLPVMLHVVNVFKNDAPALLDPELKKVALATFFYALITLATVIY